MAASEKIAENFPTNVLAERSDLALLQRNSRRCVPVHCSSRSQEIQNCTRTVNWGAQTLTAF